MIFVKIISKNINNIVLIYGVNILNKYCMLPPRNIFLIVRKKYNCKINLLPFIVRKKYYLLSIKILFRILSFCLSF